MRFYRLWSHSPQSDVLLIGSNSECVLLPLGTAIYPRVSFRLWPSRVRPACRRVMSRTRLNELCGRQMARWKPRRVSFPTRAARYSQTKIASKKCICQTSHPLFSSPAAHTVSAAARTLRFDNTVTYYQYSCPGCSFAQLGTLQRHASAGSLFADTNLEGVGWVGACRSIAAPRNPL